MTDMQDRAEDGQQVVETLNRLDSVQASADLQQITTDALKQASEAMASRLDRELHGAWRAGYDYLHVFRKNPLYDVNIGAGSHIDALTITEYYYPSDSYRPRLLEGDGIVYQHSYDLTSVPDHIIREAVRGDRDHGEVLDA